MRASRSVSLLAGISLCAVGSGCGSQQAADDGRDVPADRSRQVAMAWDGSPAAAAWRSGYHPMAEAVQLPRGGLRSEADRRAYESRSFVLRGGLPGAGPKYGRVTWAGGESVTRPLVGADESYETMAGPRNDTLAGPTNNKKEAHLTVTGAKLGEMSLATSRGPATVPAWLFELDGYATPLKQAAAVPSSSPRPPIRPTRDLPGYPVDQLVRITADGRSVTVVALHGVCDDGPVVGVLETRGSVVLSASVKGHEDGGNCTKQAKMQQVTVKLERPVGDRVLLDAHTGRPVVYKGLRTIPPTGS